MINNENAVASVDASADINRYIDGLGRLVEDHIARGYQPYLMTFMFKLAMLENRPKTNKCEARSPGFIHGS